MWDVQRYTSKCSRNIAAGLVLLPFLTPQVLSSLLAAIGGVMVFISPDELMPAARE